MPTLDRLTHRCHILEANGESYRLREAKRRNRSAPTASQTPARSNIPLAGIED